MLETLLPELFALILPLLELRDLSSLRLTSRRLERESTSTFSAAAFSEISVDFSAANLQWVRSISNHHEFRFSVRGLRVGHWGGKITGTTYDHHTSYGYDGYWPRENGTVRSEAFQKFVDCLLQFPNCGRVLATDEKVVLPYLSGYRGRERHLSSADAMDIVLRAFLAPGAPSLRCFQARIKRDLDWYPSAFLILPTFTSVDKGVMDQLKELSLELKMEREESLANPLKFIAVAPHLTTLRLIMDYELTARDGHLWPLVSQHLENLPRVTPLLDTLVLVNIRIDATSLLRILSSYTDTLKRLDLSNVTLSSGCWNIVLEGLQTFRCIRRFSMFSCREGPDRDWMAFCPLWKSCKAHKPPGARFEFRIWVTTRLIPRKLHVTGALFESKGDIAATRMALQAMVTFSHRCPADDDADPPCAEPHDFRKIVEEAGGLGRLFERWTGL